MSVGKMDAIKLPRITPIIAKDIVFLNKTKSKLFCLQYRNAPNNDVGKINSKDSACALSCSKPRNSIRTGIYTEPDPIPIKLDSNPPINAKNRKII